MFIYGQEQIARVQEAKQKTDTLLSKIMEAIQALNEFQENTRDKVLLTGRITKEISVTFKEISKGVESQAVSVSDRKLLRWLNKPWINRLMWRK
jgi:methyl-accepting chemotaxis protein